MFGFSFFIAEIILRFGVGVVEIAANVLGEKWIDYSFRRKVNWSFTFIFIPWDPIFIDNRYLGLQ